MTKHPRIWVVIANGSRARIAVPTEQPATYRTLRVFDAPEARLSAHELGDAAPGRTQESAMPGRHAIEPRSDPHEQTQVKFAHVLAAALNAASAEGAFDRIVLVAQPRIAARLSAALDESVRRKIARELAKDLTKTPDHELGGHLEAIGSAS